MYQWSVVRVCCRLTAADASSREIKLIIYVERGSVETTARRCVDRNVSGYTPHLFPDSSERIHQRLRVCSTVSTHNNMRSRI